MHTVLYNLIHIYFKLFSSAYPEQALCKHSNLIQILFYSSDAMQEGIFFSV